MIAVSPVVALVLRDRYVDSIVAMRLAQDLMSLDGVVDAAALMGTPANRALLAQGGFDSPEIDKSGPDDLVVAVRAADEHAGSAALAKVPDLLAQRHGRAARTARSLDEALRVQPTTNLVSISVPDDYAAAEATRALEAGLHVFLFSSGVTIDDEVRLKKLADERGLLCMGPDCGTAILHGTGLGFANVVRAGPVGVVGGSGTGIQAVTSLLDRLGIGTSHAIGAGSRDLSDPVGGRTTLAGLRLLEEDPGTEVIVIVSKPGSRGVENQIKAAAARGATPSVLCFLGDETSDAPTLDEAVSLVATRLGRPNKTFEWHDAPPVESLRERIGSRRFVRGLFSGGSLCAESQVVLGRAGLQVWSNTPLAGSSRIADADPSREHCLVDLGTEAFTRGRPHPMIDSRVRCARLAVEARDEEVAVVVLDIVLGWNAARSPAGDLARAIRAAVGPDGTGPVVLASVVGTDADPQQAAREEEILKDAGAIVAPTNAVAAGYAASLARSLP